MLRYCIQKDNFSCGPIAIINASKWCGLNLTLDDLKDVRKTCKTEYDGTWDEDFNIAVRHYLGCKLRIRRRVNFGYKDVKKHLKNGGAVIVSHCEVDYTKKASELDMHYSFWYGLSNLIIGVNYYDKCKNFPIIRKMYYRIKPDTCYFLSRKERDNYKAM